MRAMKMVAVMVVLVGLGAMQATTGPGVGGGGGPKRVVQITVDGAKLQALGLTAVEVRQALETHGMKVMPVAGREVRDAVFVVDSAEAMGNPAGLGDLVLKTVNGAPVRLGVVATISVVAAPAATTAPASAPASQPATSATSEGRAWAP